MLTMDACVNDGTYISVSIKKLRRNEHGKQLALK